MSNDGGDNGQTRAGQVQAAFAVARALREDAIAEAEEVRRAAAAAADLTRNDAQRLASRRLQEAELHVAKARRTVAIADEKAATIVTSAMVEAERILAEARVIVAEAVQPGEVRIDITDSVLEQAAFAANAVVAEDLDTDAFALRTDPDPTDFDRMLGKAIHQAVAQLAKVWERPSHRLTRG
jgi:hypothetical protein